MFATFLQMLHWFQNLKFVLEVSYPLYQILMSRRFVSTCREFVKTWDLPAYHCMKEVRNAFESVIQRLAERRFNHYTTLMELVRWVLQPAFGNFGNDVFSLGELSKFNVHCTFYFSDFLAKTCPFVINVHSNNVRISIRYKGTPLEISHVLASFTCN